MNSIRYVVSGFLVYTTGDFPTGTINVYGDTTIQIATTQNFSASWSAAGFSVGGTREAIP